MNWWEMLVLNYPWLKNVSENMGWVKGIGAFFGINILLRKKIRMWWDKTKIIAGTHVEVGVIKQTLTDHIAEQHRVNAEVGDKLDLILKELKANDALDWALRGFDTDSYFAASINGEIKMVSKSILKLIGCSREDFLGNRWLSFINNSIERARINSIWHQCFDNETPFEEEISFLNNAGANIYVRLKAIPVMGPDNITIQAWAGTFERIA